MPTAWTRSTSSPSSTRTCGRRAAGALRGPFLTLPHPGRVARLPRRRGGAGRAHQPRRRGPRPEPARRHQPRPAPRHLEHFTDAKRTLPSSTRPTRSKSAATDALVGSLDFGRWSMRRSANCASGSDRRPTGASDEDRANVRVAAGRDRQLEAVLEVNSVPSYGRTGARRRRHVTHCIAMPCAPSRSRARSSGRCRRGSGSSARLRTWRRRSSCRKRRRQPASPGGSPRGRAPAGAR